MTGDFVDLYRYALEQDFLNDKRKIETHRTAILSVIGDEPIDEIEKQLTQLNYAEGRFFSLAHPSIAGRWAGKGTRRIPDFAMGLILFTTQSDLALEELESEVQRYWDAGVTPLIVWPKQLRFANLIKRQLATLNGDWHFVRMKNGAGSEPTSPTDIPSMARAYIEALLIPATYPGLVCSDISDVLSVFKPETTAHILRFEAPTFEALMELARIDPPPKDKSSGMLAVLYGPSSLKFKQVDQWSSILRKQMPKGSTRIVSALADAVREKYTMYVAICE